MLTMKTGSGVVSKAGDKKVTEAEGKFEYTYPSVTEMQDVVHYYSEQHREEVAAAEKIENETERAEALAGIVSVNDRLVELFNRDAERRAKATAYAKKLNELKPVDIGAAIDRITKQLVALGLSEDMARAQATKLAENAQANAA